MHEVLHNNYSTKHHCWRWFLVVVVLVTQAVAVIFNGGGGGGGGSGVGSWWWQWRGGGSLERRPLSRWHNFQLRRYLTLHQQKANRFRSHTRGNKKRAILGSGEKKTPIRRGETE